MCTLFSARRRQCTTMGCRRQVCKHNSRKFDTVKRSSWSLLDGQHKTFSFRHDSNANLPIIQTPSLQMVSCHFFPIYTRRRVSPLIDFVLFRSSRLPLPRLGVLIDSRRLTDRGLFCGFTIFFSFCLERTLDGIFHEAADSLAVNPFGEGEDCSVVN